MLGPGCVRAEEKLVLLLLAREESLREGRPLVRGQLLVANERHAAFVPLRAQSLRAAGPGEAGPDDNHRAGSHQAASSSTTVMAAIGHAEAASSTFGSEVTPVRTEATPSFPTSMTSGASSEQTPKPLHRERSISILYTFAPFD